MSARQWLERLEKSAPPCPACGGTGTRRGASKADSEAEAWFAGLTESERRTIIGRKCRLEMMSEDGLEALVERLRRRDVECCSARTGQTRNADRRATLGYSTAVEAMEMLDRFLVGVTEDELGYPWRSAGSP